MDELMGHQTRVARVLTVEVHTGIVRRGLPVEDAIRHDGEFADEAGL